MLLTEVQNHNHSLLTLGTKLLLQIMKWVKNVESFREPKCQWLLLTHVLHYK